jgi:hypothetical protein
MCPLSSLADLRKYEDYLSGLLIKGMDVSSGSGTFRMKAYSGARAEVPGLLRLDDQASGLRIKPVFRLNGTSMSGPMIT